MKVDYAKDIKERTRAEEFAKLEALGNPFLFEFVADAIRLCNPRSVFVRTDSRNDNEYIRKKAVTQNEEISLAVQGHTLHFDGFFDQGRDKGCTKYLLPAGVSFGKDIASIEKQAGLKEVRGILANSMRDKEMIVAFFCLGPTASEFAIPCLQITDSAYVAHSESLLYRNGYEEFKARGAKKDFFRFLHSAGALENNVSADVKNKRIYIDIFENTVYSANTQYAGNTVGLKKLALRLAIRKASEEQWLAEHMFIMGVKGPGAKRISYFTGAFPSACGKTATAMLKDETIVGDDIAYLKKKHGAIYGVNVEAGIFGIISDVNEKNDPLIWDALHRPGEVIFSNVLLTKDNTVRWLGDGLSAPKEGVNFSGQWREGARDASGNAIPCAHKNARYTIRLESLGNCDPHLNDPQGVAIDGVIYGGRDSDTWVPVQEAFDWAHGVITMGASLESETTQATIGKEGVRTFNPMSNIDFLAIPIGRYITMHLDFAKGLTRAPKIFAVNYFLKNKEGKYLNAIDDKHVWIKWMELRVHNEAKVLTMPTGLIPCFEDLARLFKEVLGKDYTREHYETQFGLKIRENLAKIARIEDAYKTKVLDTPAIVFTLLAAQKQRLLEARKKFGDVISPSSLTQ